MTLETLKLCIFLNDGDNLQHFFRNHSYTRNNPILGGGAVLPRVGYISPPQLGPISKAVEVIATVISCYIQYVTPTAAPSIVGMGKVP